jgi:hypothetical protein
MPGGAGLDLPGRPGQVAVAGDQPAVVADAVIDTVLRLGLQHPERHSRQVHRHLVVLVERQALGDGQHRAVEEAVMRGLDHVPDDEGAAEAEHPRERRGRQEHPQHQVALQGRRAAAHRAWRR